jgi:proteic killer suppression protein
MIRSFRSRVERGIWRGEVVPALPIAIQQRARRKLRMLNRAQTLADLAVPPGNRLERLSGDRAENYSVRINEQWRICFTWSEGDCFDVQILDCH